jgi:hypothetical protein
MMKKIYLLIMMIACASFVFAQTPTKTGIDFSRMISGPSITIKSMDSKAIGDTLMHFDGSSFFVNPTDEAGFGFQNEDIDGLTSHNAGWTAFMGFYSLDPLDFLHNDVDTAFMIGATSWFTPAGTSDDWFEFGPLTIPAGEGASITYATHCNPYGLDGFTIDISTTGMNNSTDFTDPPIYTQLDQYPPGNPVVDTVWGYRTVNIPASYYGSPVYIAFHHVAVDIDVLWLDEISVIETPPVGINEQNAVNATIYSNANNLYVNINKVENGFVNIYDGIGQLVKSVSVDKTNMVINMSGVASGIYMVNVKIGDKVFNKKVVF